MNDAFHQRRRGPVTRKIEVLQDLYWPENVAAAKLTEQVSSAGEVRDYIRDRAFQQPSWETRDRYALYFLKWFVPGTSMDDPVPACWRAFHDSVALEHVMRWQFITSNPLIAEFVDGPLSHIEPGEQVNSAVDSFLTERLESVPEKSRTRLRAALTKVGLLMSERGNYYRVIPEVSPKAVALLVAYLFAPEPQAVSTEMLLADSWWKRLGIVSEAALREKLRETADEGLFARVSRMDTLDQLTTRYSWRQFAAGKVKRQ